MSDNIHYRPPNSSAFCGVWQYCWRDGDMTIELRSDSSNQNYSLDDDRNIVVEQCDGCGQYRKRQLEKRNIEKVSA